MQFVPLSNLDAMSRLILVSNRLPLTASVSRGEVRIERSAGGLASAVRGVHEEFGGIWIGWPGDSDRLSASQRTDVEAKLAESRACPVWLSEREVRRFYDGFSNGVLWPVLHHLTGAMPLEVEGWEEYEAVNQRFADRVVQEYREGDVIWVHDYHLMLVPRMVRARLPESCIGYFLHTPFPCADLFPIVPHREALLEGVLGADLIGFHTRGYRHHFEECVERTLGFSAREDGIDVKDRRVTLGEFPIGIDAAAVEAAATSDSVLEGARVLRGDWTFRIMVGVDRLDYTKGIPRRLLAFERLLTQHPEWREAVTLLQIAVPSRTRVGPYQALRAQVDELVLRINDGFGTDAWTPVRYVHRSVSDTELLALYRAADVMLVTPVRDGMNLVAKEFVASRTDGDGVLVLSEFAGAAAELRDAVLVNPYDVERTTDAFYRALTMPVGERRARMRALRSAVSTHSVHDWTKTFLQAARDAHRAGAPPLRATAAAAV